MVNDGVLRRLDSERLGLVVSPPKTATTWLYDVFCEMPDVRVGRSKEIRFLSRPNGRTISWYQCQFRRTGNATGPLIDVCHDYFSAPQAPRRAVELDPDVRVVVVLRHPVRRAHSDYLNVLRAGTVSGSIRDAAKVHTAILGDSRYVDAARRWVDALGPERCRFMLYEDITLDPARFATDVAAHLGLDQAVELASAMETRSHTASTSRVPKLTRSFRKVAGALQNRGLHRMVHGIKRSKLLRWTIYRELDPATTVLSPDDVDWLHGELMMQCAELEQLTGLDLSTWTDAAFGSISGQPSRERERRAGGQ